MVDFPGAGTADDGGGFADVCRKADIVQHRFLRTFILEGNVAKFQLGFRKVLPWACAVSHPYRC